MLTFCIRWLRRVDLLLVGGTALATTACVSSDAGIGSYEAKPVDAAGNVASGNGEVTPGGVSITAGEVPEFASQYVGAVRLILNNATSDFIRVDSVSLSFGPGLDEHVSIPAGDDIAGWGRAMAPRVSSWTGRNHAEPGYRPSSDIVADIERFEQLRLGGGRDAPPFPSEHLLAAPFSIAPGLSTIKWLLIKSDANVGVCLERMVVTLQTSRQGPQRLLVQFRDKALTQSAWQRAACAAAAPRDGWGV